MRGDTNQHEPARTTGKWLSASSWLYKLWILFFLVFLVTSGLFAFGRVEEPVQEPVNTDYIFCITAFDVSALPLSRQLMGDTVARSLLSSLERVDFRLRSEEESAYYRDYAWAKSRTEAAKALQVKRGERDLLIYKGERSWKYRKNLKAVDEAIEKLEENLAQIEALAPVVEGKPVFALSEANLNGIYPAPPAQGGEYRFCTEQKADAFLTGSLSEYHGRIYLDIKMYTVSTRSFIYEDSILFSSEDLTGAMDEISGRLAAAAAGIRPAAVLVHASPPDAIVLVDGSYAGRGEMEEMYMHSPGEAEIELRADNYQSVSFPLELRAGELAELYFDLTPLSLAAFGVTVPDSPGSRVYLGSLYVGETPHVLQLPGTQYAYISVETPEGEAGSVVYKDNEVVKGRAQFIRNYNAPDEGGTAAFSTRVPINPEEKRVDRARKGFYRAYGAFWVILPVALLTAGVALTYVDANNYVAATGYYSDYDTRKKIYDDAVTGSRVRLAATITWGAALGVTFFQIFRYLYVSGADSMPIVKAPKSEPGTEP